MKLCLLVLSLGLLPFSFGQSVEQSRITSQSAARVEVQFRLYRKYLIVVQGSLGRFDGLNFLVDTGANPTALDQRIAKKLGIHGHHRELDLLDQSTAVQEAVLPAIQVGPIRGEFLRCVVQDLSPLERNLGVRIDAIVGFDVLGTENFAVNYESTKIIFGDIEPLPFSVPFDTGPPRLTVQLRVGDEPLRLLLDTGAQDLLLFGCSLPDRLNELAIVGVKKSSSTQDVVFDVQEARLSGVHLGAANLGAVRVFLVPGNQSCGWPFGGVMGMAAFDLREVAFDFERKMFSFKR
jgi:predicted aspartyl protease